MSLLPCETCPWRKGNDASVIPRYDQKLAERLLNTVGEDDAFRPVMACHNSTDEVPVSCKGYLARAGWTNLNVRLLLSRKQIENPQDVLDACKAEGVKLEKDYPAILRKLSRTPKKQISKGSK